MKVWLDDERAKPDDFDIHVRTANEAIEVLRTGKVTAISLDYYLGEGLDNTGLDVAEYIENAALSNDIPKLRVYFHTSSEAAKWEMKAVIRRAYEYWMEHSRQEKDV